MRLHAIPTGGLESAVNSAECTEKQRTLLQTRGLGAGSVTEREGDDDLGPVQDK